MKKTLSMFQDLMEVMLELAENEETPELKENLEKTTLEFIEALKENEEEALQWVKWRNGLDGMLMKGLWNKGDVT